MASTSELDLPLSFPMTSSSLLIIPPLTHTDTHLHLSAKHSSFPISLLSHSLSPSFHTIISALMVSHTKNCLLSVNCEAVVCVSVCGAAKRVPSVVNANSSQHRIRALAYMYNDMNIQQPN